MAKLNNIPNQLQRIAYGVSNQSRRINRTIDLCACASMRVAPASRPATKRGR